MKRKRILPFLMAMAMTAGLLTQPAKAGQAFPDVSDDASYVWAVELTKQIGLFTGDENGNFNPDDGITRAEFAAVVCRLLGGEEEAKTLTDSGFIDVPENHWAAGYVAWAAGKGIINGYGDGNFGPADQVLYEQAVKMLVCAEGYDDVAQDAGGWPNGYITAAEKMNILSGVEGEQGMPITRANVAVLVKNIYTT